MDERRPAGPAGRAEGAGFPERPLGRGLEDVSHLFLTQSEQGPLHGRSGMGPPSDRGEARVRTGAVTPLQRVEGLTRVQLAGILRDRNLGLEAGLTVFDESVPCPPYGEIDLLAVDTANQLTIIDFDIVENDQLFTRGLGHVDWVLRNLPNVRRMYTGRAINFAAVPRVLLLAPGFSQTLQHVAPSIGQPQVDCLEYHVVHLNGGYGILFDRLTAR